MEQLRSNSSNESTLIIKTKDFGPLEVPKYLGETRSCLRPFSGQVSGHSSFFSLPNGNVMKAVLSERELWFYTQLFFGKNKNLKVIPWVPTFRGCVLVPNTSKIQKRPSTSQNPWCERILRDSHDGKKDKEDQEIFLVLEDLSSSYCRPCVMDIKIGKKTVGKSASEKVRKRHDWKCEQTTSACLGLRIAGMQVFVPKENQYGFFNKYEGREVTEESFPETILKFFQNGSSFRRDVVQEFLSQLESLIEAFSFREYSFYSTSLLFFYEGEPNGEDGTVEPRPVLRLVDFSEAYLEYEEENEGFLDGLSNLQRILHSILLRKDVDSSSCLELSGFNPKPITKPSKWVKNKDSAEEESSEKEERE
mmetsp:Transcript_39583/g.55150  ORF Transcript_39583/g.55150 Transcript_39583/m.55150 type:complete len:363 (-) Transcript_39583:26-1114(-)|eukprot:CAMPEP_0201481346 /NCGR_PEP_ID=MMETSP0151_2-20130828/5616_1 /ASSEMBLY_ACC=CAM_ASM_000257 /TAXON_ID=200890 /ORGANISM="Paramoeba atlantica, Strain 621/1 / CCAP 1560/9" /LENGTH=362 /DNA_ID=CAMNT_0047863489 /DNA_START=30 /DNA_END=1118 /DNA_ORIENTATION=+